jgi:hypothetical protein
MGCAWLAANAPAVLELAAAAGVFPAAASIAEAPVDDTAGVVPAADMLVSVWLIDINWSSWLSDTIWPTISVGSTGEVGSWFCNSVTSRFRNVSCRLVEDCPSPLLEEELLLEFDDVVFAVAEFALCPITGALIFGVMP